MSIPPHPTDLTVVTDTAKTDIGIDFEVLLRVADAQRQRVEDALLRVRHSRGGVQRARAREAAVILAAEFGRRP
jgi:hypothetical protein